MAYTNDSMDKSKAPMPPFKIGSKDMKSATKAVKKMSKADRMAKIEQAQALKK
jgi:hypothetical protein